MKLTIFSCQKFDTFPISENFFVFLLGLKINRFKTLRLSIAVSINQFLNFIPMIIKRKYDKNSLVKIEKHLDMRDMFCYFDKNVGAYRRTTYLEKEPELIVLRYTPIISSVWNR